MVKVSYFFYKLKEIRKNYFMIASAALYILAMITLIILSSIESQFNKYEPTVNYEENLFQFDKRSDE